MDWFERLTGFSEDGYERTRERLLIQGGRLHSLVNGCSYGIGELELLPLQALRERHLNSAGASSGQIRVSIVTGNVRPMHHLPEHDGALFQVASQFNLLEMVSPAVTPEDGVTRYEHDHTQGPACAIAAGAATIYRNYFAPINGAIGQTSQRQIDALAGLGQALSVTTARAVDDLWTMRNGYALCSAEGLCAITDALQSMNPSELDALRARLCIGVHWRVEVTDMKMEPRNTVSQAFCSALPVAYSNLPGHNWRPLASLVLEAAYEATLLAAAENSRSGGSNVVLLTRLGGGVFGNEDEWIDSAMRRALQTMRYLDLDVKLVSHGQPSVAMLKLAQELQ
ncbi:MAG: hypothetical protein U1D36_17925 [Hydrogenophaga sp.]|uniref:hypothetical protein n=1 Tax=Hydrogenophaga sp. TaxID=1904254 RepID=UPI0027303076|nr:hypothetical protein [Hydrogenophaga sp.]MDP2406279.1 hypothetical protein [Hydrogenophaga sp.]MDZ4176336.1 hypothetical protein [Hydrogenophaga sp.]